MSRVIPLLIAAMLLVLPFNQSTLAMDQDDTCFDVTTDGPLLPRSIQENQPPPPPGSSQENPLPPPPGEFSDPTGPSGGVIPPPPPPGESSPPGGLPGGVIPSGQPSGPTAAAGNGPGLTIPDEIPKCVTEAEVVRVIDGETIDVEITERRDPEHGQTKTVRLLLIDAPRTGASGAQCYGEEAAEAARTLLMNRTVYLERDASDTDPDGRLLRYVWFEHDGELYLTNEVLVRYGYAVLAWTLPDVLYMRWIGDAEMQAIEQDAGLWAACRGMG